MTARLDDALIHQNYGTLEQVVEDDKRWFDRFYFNVQSTDGSLSVAQGIGVYPNMGVMDGFCLVCTPDRQINVRASRELVNGNRDEMDIGPIHAEILEPMQRWRFRLDENAQGTSYDIEYIANFRPLDPLRLISTVEGKRVWDWTHFGHVGRVRGWVQLGDARFELTPERHYAIRDRSWGVRPGIAIIEDTSAWFKQANWGTRYNWVCVQLQSFYLWYFQTHEADGTSRFFEGLIRWSDDKGGHQEKVSRVIRHVESADNEHFVQALVEVHLESGAVMEVKMRRLDTSIHLRGGNYGGLNGIIHGMRQGPLKVSGETWAPSDTRQNPATGGIQEHVVEVSCNGETGYGIYEVPYGS